MNTPKAELRDDGTLDTVIQVGDKTYRYNYDGEPGLNDEEGAQSYDEFIEWALTDAEEQYEIDKMESEL